MEQHAELSNEEEDDVDSRSEEHDEASLAGSSSNSQKHKSFVPPANWANAPEFVPRSFGTVFFPLNNMMLFNKSTCIY